MSTGAEICRRYSIEDHLRSKGLDVVRVGRKLRCRCPLHKGGQERTPSFYITDRPGGGQWFKCFGCDEGGDVITLVAKMEGKTNGEAMGMLARKLGIREGEVDETPYMPPSHHTVLSAFCVQEELAVDISSYLMTFMKAEGGSKDAVNKASYVYRKLDECIVTSDTDGMKRLLAEVKAATKDYHGPLVLGT